MTGSFEEAIRKWAQNPKLEKAQGTKILEMRQAIRPNQIYSPKTLDPAQEDRLQRLIGTIIWDRVEKSKLQIFVVEHDWGAAFAGASEELTSAEHQLPYPICLFEFRINGRRLGVVAFKRELNDGPYEIHGLLNEPAVNGWFYVHLYSAHLATVRALVEKQIAAVCVALEAQVAETEVIRAPLKLNAARERRGQPPMPDYRVVQLARRSKVSPLLISAYHDDEHRKSPRLHFRRGHWAHFANHRTWRRWTLVGNPDTGFIDKHYRL
jgi:hypothetical protein